MEQMRGVKPPSQPWQGRILIVEPHLQWIYIHYIKKILNRITFLGSTFIAIIAGLPIVFSSFISTGLPASVRIGGTGVLIVVGVAIETCRQLESSLINRSYKGAR